MSDSAASLLSIAGMVAIWISLSSPERAALPPGAFAIYKWAGMAAVAICASGNLATLAGSLRDRNRRVARILVAVGLIVAAGVCAAFWLQVKVLPGVAGGPSVRV